MLAGVREHRDVWEKSLRKLRGRQMPPPGSRQPSQAEIDGFGARRARSAGGDADQPGKSLGFHPSMPVLWTTRRSFALASDFRVPNSHTRMHCSA